MTPTLTSLAELRERTLARWRTLLPRERALLSTAAVVVAAAAIWLAVLRPALLTLEQAPREIAELRATRVRVQDEARALAELGPSATASGPTAQRPAPGDLGAAATAWLKDHDPEARVTPGPAQDSGIALRIAGMNPAGLPQLAAAARRDWGAELVAVDLAADVKGRLGGTVTLAPLQEDAR